MAVRNNIVSSRAEVETYDALIKLILIGNSSVGKTCLILRYVENTYQKNFLPTIGKSQYILRLSALVWYKREALLHAGVDFKTKNVKYENGRYKIQIWWVFNYINLKVIIYHYIGIVYAKIQWLVQL